MSADIGKFKWECRECSEEFAAPLCTYEPQQQCERCTALTPTTVRLWPMPESGIGTPMRLSQRAVFYELEDDEDGELPELGDRCRECDGDIGGDDPDLECICPGYLAWKSEMSEGD